MTYAEFLEMNPYHGMKVSFEYDEEWVYDKGIKYGTLSRPYFGNYWGIKKEGYESDDIICIFDSDAKEEQAMLSGVINLKPMANNTHPLADLKAGDYLYRGTQKRRVLSDVHHPELGELATVLVSMWDEDKSNEDLKEVDSWKTLFQLSYDGWHKETPRTIDDVLATLSEEDRKIVEDEIK